MRLLVKIVLSCLGLVLLLLSITFLWFRYYTHDLSDIEALARYAPASATQVSNACLGQSVAIPYEKIGERFVPALNAAETRLSVQISRSMFCRSQSKTLPREIAELRLAAQIEMRFNKQQILTIYANRAYFGADRVGILSAAQFFFQKDTEQLDTAQTALLAGLLRSPSSYSPVNHPDRALQRRNQVIDAMVSNGSITHDEAEKAKAEPLLSSQ